VPARASAAAAAVRSLSRRRRAVLWPLAKLWVCVRVSAQGQRQQGQRQQDILVRQGSGPRVCNVNMFRGCSQCSCVSQTDARVEPVKAGVPAGLSLLFYSCLALLQLACVCRAVVVGPPYL
jgi:hypothetical protein